MRSQITNESASPFVPVEPEKWQTFFEAFTHVLEGRVVEIETIGLQIGDQIEAEWVPLGGLVYDRKDDTFYVYVEDGDRDLGHAIFHPREILVRLGASGIEQVVIRSADLDKHIISLRQPLMLPQAVG